MQRAFSPSSYLDRQADHIEALLLDYEVPARVDGGMISEDRVRYHLTPNVGTGMQNLLIAADRVAETLGVEGMQIEAEGDGVTLDLPLRPATGLRMLPLLHSLRQIKPCTSLVGMQVDHKPLLVDWSRPSTWHAWISAPGGSGKSELLRSMLLSLALTSRSSEVQFLGIDLSGRQLSVMEALPHSTYALATDADYASEMIHWLLGELDHRRRVGFSNPHLFLFIDEIAGLWRYMGHELESLLRSVALQGRQAGMHIVGASQPVVWDQLPSLHALPGIVRILPDQTPRNDLSAPIGRFAFHERNRQTVVDIAWLTARDLDTAVDLIRSGWRACERG